LSHRACDFIRENKADPWALYLTLFAVHTPIQAKKDLVKKYQDKSPGSQHSNVAMATMIQAVDDGVGKILAELKELGLTEKTAILFFSDNGGYGPATDMAPLKGYKGTYYEGGIRVPFFVNWPGKVKAGQTNETPIIGVDLFPTLCRLAKADLPEGQPLDGKDLVPLFTGSGGGELAERPLYWHFPAYLQSYQRNDQQRDPLFRSRPCSIIRKGNWKLHEYFEDGDFELYHLADDIGEENNLAKSNPEKLSELKGILSEWRKEIKAPVPSEKNPKYNPEVEQAALKGKSETKKGRKKQKQ
jgi:arylsulfatase A-like enzyme